MARTAEQQAKQAELVDRLERGILELTSSARWQEYLTTAAKFHNYSANNLMLILMQRPEATRVAGFRTWLSMGRAVRKGERGIAILAPCVYGGQTREDEETGERVTTERRVVGFRTVYVFDVSQTDGDELPSPVVLLEGDSASKLLARLELVAGELGYHVERANFCGSQTNGDTSFELKRIRLNRDRSIDQQAKTLAHELGHVLCHHERANYSAERERCELEAESVAFVVCSSSGLETDNYSFGYVAHWSGAKAIHESAGTILEAADELLERLEVSADRFGEQAAAETITEATEIITKAAEREPEPVMAEVVAVLATVSPAEAPELEAPEPEPGDTLHAPVVACAPRARFKVPTRTELRKGGGGFRAESAEKMACPSCFRYGGRWSHTPDPDLPNASSCQICGGLGYVVCGFALKVAAA
jgi:antirestriction protein ArdC